MPEEAASTDEFPTPHDRAFGEIVVEMGLTDQAAVDECLALQVRYAFSGQEVPSLPQLLVGRQIISQSQAERALTKYTEQAAEDGPALAPDKDFSDTSKHLPALDDGAPEPAGPRIILPAAPVGEADKPPEAEAGPRIIGPEKARGSDLPQVPRISYPTGTGTLEIIMPASGGGETTAKAPPGLQEELTAAPAPESVPVEEVPLAATPTAQPAVPTSQPVPGEPIKGYKLMSRVSTDETGAIFKAKQVAMDRLVALKVLPPKMTQDHTFVERFLQEARDAGQLNHPNLARVHEVGRTGRYYFYSMELVEGKRLDENIRLGGPMHAPRALQVTMEICKAIDHMAGKNILHGEISPQAVVITSEGAVKLLLAGLGGSREGRTRFLVGDRFHYVAPERALSDTYDVRADLYSAGAVLYFALTGQHPYGGANANEVLNQQFSSPPPDPREVSPALAADVVKVVTKAMSKNRTARFGGPDEMIAAIEQAMAAARPHRPHGTRGTRKATRLGTTTRTRAPKLRRRRRKRR